MHTKAKTKLTELRQRQQTPQGRAQLRERVAVEDTATHVGWVPTLLHTAFTTLLANDRISKAAQKPLIE